MTVEVTTPPIIGVAMRFITSAPAPWLQSPEPDPAANETPIAFEPDVARGGPEAPVAAEASLAPTAYT